MTAKIVILGGGFGGLFGADALQKRLKGRAEIEVINAENYFVFQPLLPEVAAGAVSPINAVSPLRILLKKVRHRKAVVDGVDFDAKRITVFQGVQRRPTEVPYDHLVIALGQGSDLSRTPGLGDHALTMKTLEDARRMRAHVVERLEHADVTSLPEVKRSALTFVVVGGGFSGIETVGEMKELIDRSLKYYPNIRRSEIRVIVLEFAPAILGEMPKKLADYAMRNLRNRGIEVMLNTGVASMTGTQIVTTTGEVIDTRTVVATIGNAPHRVVRNMDVPLEGGKIVVDRAFRVKDRPDVWSLGDCALIPMKDEPTARGDYAPPTAQFAVREARQLAANIDAALSGRAPEPFSYKSKGALASLGARRAVAEVFGLQLTGFVAWLLWRAYYVAFLPGVTTRAQVLLSWLLDSISVRSTVQLRAGAAPSARHIHYRAGDRIYEVGTRSDGFFTLIGGEVEITGVDHRTGAPRVRTITPGGHFGERILIGATRRISSARAKTDATVLVLGREEFLKLAEGLPVLREYIKAHLAREGLDWPEPD